MQNSLSLTFQAMSDPARRAILMRLSTGAAPVGELARPLAMTAPAVSHHLKVLERAGLVERRADGQQRVISLKPEGFQEMERWLRDLHRFWATGFDRLDAQLKAQMDRGRETREREEDKR
jgi:DNA-binding transcriptional ArsR family regulator